MRYASNSRGPPVSSGGTPPNSSRHRPTTRIGFLTAWLVFGRSAEHEGTSEPQIVDEYGEFAPDVGYRADRLSHANCLVIGEFELGWRCSAGLRHFEEVELVLKQKVEWVTQDVRRRNG